ncbi:hypothetical protein [Nostoc sp. 106C]|uniref:hypothetical protein n=1 Tax=Nostoc sp. 106C TaxID=1932667 RepID=UPI000A36347F|nr:hypothetical protein [Nostoc sp. 106C]OUL24294.1 hypothetical protein BV375_24080 [Nostoc sp. 106C]
MKKFKKIHKLKALLIAAIALLFLCTTTQAQPVKPVANTLANPDYVRALFTADKFLYTWKTRNVAEGIALVSPALKNKISNDELASYISGTSSPSHAAFEINAGRKLSDGRYGFEVKLYEYLYSATPESQSWKCPRLSRIVLIKTGVDNPKFRVGNWLVDELPATCELQLR